MRRNGKVVDTSYQRVEAGQTLWELKFKVLTEISASSEEGDCRKASDVRRRDIEREVAVKASLKRFFQVRKTSKETGKTRTAMFTSSSKTALAERGSSNAIII